MMGVAALGFGGLSVGMWLVTVAGWAVPVGAARGAVALALAAGMAWLALLVGGALGRAAAGRRRAWTLLGLVALALVVRFTGLDHELVDRPYLDEGTYYHHAREIDEGEPFSPSFVYPHLVYQADAFTLWVADLYRPWLQRAFAAWRGPDDPASRDPHALDWLLLRTLVALCGALTVLPVFRIAEVVAGEKVGTTAGALAALLVTFAPSYNEVSHLNISDLPAAFFATLCLAAAARLLAGESAGAYLAAGVAAGLAAGSKYPAGVVALAVAAVWLRHRLAAYRASRRSPGGRPAAAGEAAGPALHAGGAGWWGSSGGLLLAGLGAVAVFLLATPSLLVFPEQAVVGDRGIFFGVRQYGEGGWIGVQPHSNALFYGRLAVGELGWVAVVVGLAGLALLRRRQAARLAWLLPFPLAYLLLVSSMNMVVRRNLLPVVPALAALAGVGLAVAWGWLATRLPGQHEAAGRDAAAGRRWRRVAGAVLAVLVLAPPASRSLAASVAMARPSTRERARDWLLHHAPPGAAVVRESYGPDLPPERFAVWKSRFAARFPLAELRRGQVDYLLLNSAAYSRFLDPETYTRAHHETYGEWYREVFAEVPRVAEFEPGRFTWGPVVRIHRLEPRQVAAGPVRVAAADLFVPDGGMRRRRAVVWFRPGQWALAKADLAAGRWRLAVEGAVATAAAPPRLRALRADGGEPIELPLRDGAAELPVDAPGRRFLYLDLPVGSRVSGVRLTPVGAASAVPDSSPPPPSAQ